MGTWLSWGQLGPCTDVPEFSVFPLWLSSVWSPWPSGGSVRFSVTLSTRGGSEPPPHPSAFPTWVPPFWFFFFLFTWSSHGAVPGQGGPCCDQQVKSCC